MGQKYTAFLIWRYLRRHRFSALATLLAVTFGVATFFTILSVMEGYRVKLRVLVRGLESHLSLVSNPALTLQGAEEFQRIVEGVPHVVATAPFIQTIALYNSFGSFSYLEVKGIDPVREAKVGDLEFHLFRSEELEERIFKEEFEEPDQGSSPGERAVPSREELERRIQELLDRDRQPLGDEEIEGIFSRERRIQVLTRANPGRPPDPRGAIAGGLVVGINLLLDREVFLGDEVKVVTISPENKKPLMENFVVVGAFKSGEFEVDSRTALVRIEKLRDFLDLFDPGTGESLSEGVRVALDDFELVDGVRSLIFKALVDETVRTRLPEVLELIEEIAASFRDEKAMGDLIEEISPLWDDVQAPPPGELQSAFKKAAEDLASRDTLRKAREEIQLDWETLFTRFPNDLSQQGLLLGALHSTAAAWEETLGLGEAAGSPLERVVRGFLYRTAVGDLIVEGRELVYRLVPDSFTVQILTWKDRRTVLLQAVEREKSIVSFLVFLINAFIACLVLLMLLLMVIEKTRDIGVMIALGGTTRGVVSIFLCTGLTIVLVGIILGLVVGYYFVLNINTIHDTIHHLTGIQLFDPDIYKLDHLPTTLSVKQVLVSVAPAIGLGIFASLIPALWASRRDPIKAIHYE